MLLWRNDKKNINLIFFLSVALAESELWFKGCGFVLFNYYTCMFDSFLNILALFSLIICLLSEKMVNFTWYIRIPVKFLVWR